MIITEAERNQMEILMVDISKHFKEKKYHEKLRKNIHIDLRSNSYFWMNPNGEYGIGRRERSGFSFNKLNSNYILNSPDMFFNFIREWDDIKIKLSEVGDYWDREISMLYNFEIE